MKEVIESLLNKFKLKEKKRLGYYAIVDFSQEAKLLGLSSPKTIYYFKDGNWFAKESYEDPSAEIEELRSEGIFVKDLTLGKEISPDSQFVPRRARLSASLQTGKYIRGMEVVESV